MSPNELASAAANDRRGKLGFPLFRRKYDCDKLQKCNTSVKKINLAWRGCLLSTITLITIALTMMKPTRLQKMMRASDAITMLLTLMKRMTMMIIMKTGLVTITITSTTTQSIGPTGLW